MSVILDALRKAEGERELAYIPTLTTMHEEPGEVKRRALPWIVACALLTSAAGVLLVSLDPPARVSRPATDAGPSAISSPAADDAETPQEQPSQRGIQRRSSSSKAKAPDTGAAKPRESADVTLPRSLRGRVPVPARAAGLPDPQQTEAREAEPRAQGSAREQNASPQVAAPGPATAAVPEPKPVVPAPVAPLVTPKAETRADPAPAPVQSAPIPKTAAVPGADRAVPAPVAPLLTAKVEPRADPTPPPAQSAPLPRTDTSPSRLAEALAKLTLNVLIYSEDAAERRVFISGRRYIEGERVDDLFLVKEIRPEGVLLSRQGEQALLRLPGRSR